MSDADPGEVRGRFVYRPHGGWNAPVIECRVCNETFSGWPGTWSHGWRHCAGRILRGVIRHV